MNHLTSGAKKAVNYAEAQNQVEKRWHLYQQLAKEESTNKENAPV
jgi:hypothetical protein